MSTTRAGHRNKPSAPAQEPAERPNPFLKQADDVDHGPAPLEADPVLGMNVSLIGRALDGADEPDANGVWLVGAAGGVGVTTLAQACGNTVRDAGESEPPWGGRVVIVTSAARTSLVAAQELVRASRAGTVPWEAVAMVLVHDRPSAMVSKQTQQLARETLRMVRKGLAVPFLPELRESADPSLDLGVTRARKVVEALEKLAGKAGAHKKKER